MSPMATQKELWGHRDSRPFIWEYHRQSQTQTGAMKREFEAKGRMACNWRLAIEALRWHRFPARKSLSLLPKKDRLSSPCGQRERLKGIGKIVDKQATASPKLDKFVSQKVPEHKEKRYLPLLPPGRSCLLLAAH